MLASVSPLSGRQFFGDHQDWWQRQRQRQRKLPTRRSGGHWQRRSPTRSGNSWVQRRSRTKSY
ncbi:uncharacterized protein DS421_1g31190 [Arachis hypogaea]|nr:uncharacterized protein DS421_1g31190 [Arachis hypogaea]